MSDISTSFDPRNVVTCARCGLRYDWRRSPSSSLKMTYCGSLCERADLGFTLESLLRMGEARPAAAEPVIDFTAVAPKTAEEEEVLAA